MKRNVLRTEWIVLLGLMLLAPNVFSQSISYMIPDIGTPGMNTYVEIIGPHDLTGNFGPDGFGMNNPGDALRVECVNPGDSAKVIIGPLVVSWNGRMISTQIFVHPDQRPNSDSWQGIAPEFVIPIRVSYNGMTQNSALFYIVRPQPAIITSSNGALGSGGVWGLRSPRGAMIVDSLALLGSSYGISTADCDPSTPGNQGYLPAVILSKHHIRTGNNTLVSLDANAKHGGPGGGGGGGSFCDWSGGGSDGGEGFTGGGRGGRNRAGNPLGSNEFRNPGPGSGAFITNTGGSMNGVRGGNAPAYEASGGGTGHPFGSSGTGCDDGGGCNPPGGFGGGSGQQQTQSGGAGGYATAGSSSRNGNGGQVHGNDFIVPLAGGSGGASGNPQLAFSCSGDGGGGGGALRMYAPQLDGYLFTSNGSGGSNGASGDGGSGSGGAVSLESKIVSGIWKIRAEGGIGTGPSGGAGRIRMDGPMMWFSNAIPVDESMSVGPSTDTTTFVRRQFTLTGTGDGRDIRLLLKSDRMPWTEIGTVSSYGSAWSFDITLPSIDNVYFLAALQTVENPGSDAFTARPAFVMSQAAANILISRTVPEMLAESSRQLRPIDCEQSSIDTTVVENIGDGVLLISDARYTGGRGFELLEPLAFPISIDPGDSRRFIVRYTRPAGARGTVADTLLIFSNTPGPGPFAVTYSIDVDEAELRPSLTDLVFPDVIICEGNSADAFFDLANTGTIPLTIALPVIDEMSFALISPAPGVWPLTLQPGAVLNVQLRVTHVVAGNRSGTIRFQADDNGCNVSSVITLTARARNVGLGISAIDPFSRLRCFGESADSSFIIRNDGDIEFIVTEITPPDPAFIVLSPAVPFPIGVGEQREVRLRFAPAVPGSYAGNVHIAIDRCALQADLFVTGVRDSIGVSVADVDFGLVRAQSLPVMRMVRVTNTGSAPVTITSATDIPPFRIVGGIPVNLPPGAGADLRVQFDDPGVDAEYDVEIPLQHLPFCSELLLNVHGIRGTATVDLFVDTLSAEPGQLIEIPIYLKNANNITLFGATGIRATLRYRSSLLVPTQSPLGTLSGDDRLIDLTIPLQTDADGVALRLPMMVTLGDAIETELLLENVVSVGGDLTVNVVDGRFTLLGICREGGTRLFDGGPSVQLKQNRPNPFNPTTDIEFVLIERGHTTLRVYDALGRSVATLADEWFEPGTHVRSFVGNGLPSGLYIAVLQTPTIVRQRRMLLMK